MRGLDGASISAGRENRGCPGVNLVVAANFEQPCGIIATQPALFRRWRAHHFRPLRLFTHLLLFMATAAPLAPTRRSRGAVLRARVLAAVCALALLCPMAPTTVWAQNQLPSLGDPAGADFGVGTERKLGDAIMREIRVDPDYLDDPVLLEYLQSIWQPLMAQARLLGYVGADVDQRFAWEPFLVRDKEVNAFALPGGYVGVNLGLIALTDTPSELASVLGHELSHVTQHHIARSIANSKRQSLLSLATLLAGVLVASKAGSSSADAANAAIVGSQAMAAQGQLNFSREMEREADRTGFMMLSGAGFAPAGMVAMFEKLEQSSRLNDSGGYPYLRSHPLTSERIAEARLRLGTAAPGPTPRTLEHAAAQARARVMMDTGFDALRRWQGLDGDRAAATAADKLANAYASALASTLLRDWTRADASIAAALHEVRAQPASKEASTDRLRADRSRAERAVVLLKAQSLLARGEAAKAVAALQPYADDGSRPVLLLEAQATLAQAGDTAVASRPGVGTASLDASAAALRTWVALHPLDSLVWTALSQTTGRLGQPLRSIRADAESRVALGDLTGAADRLRAGQQRAREGGAIDFIEASVIDARLRDVAQQRKQVEEDEKALR
jgi:predicted Zn-dependent protease